MRQKRLVLLSTRGTKEGNHIDRKPHILCLKVRRYTDTNFMMGYTCCTTHRKSLRHERGFFLMIYWVSWWWKKENDPQRCLCMCVCVCVCVCAMCKLYSKRVFLMAFHSLTFSQTSYSYLSSSRWSQVKLALLFVMILPAEENMRSGALVGALKRRYCPSCLISL